MHGAIRRGLAGVHRADETGRRRARVAVTWLFLTVVCAAVPAVASAQSSETAVTIPGSPLSVYVGPRGECQSSYVVNGQVAGNYFYGGNTVGDCGFFLAFPKEVSGKANPAALQGHVYGFDGAAGPHMSEEEQVYVPLEQTPVTGAGTEASPYSQTTRFAVEHTGTIEAEIIETTTYVNGAPQFTSTYTVKNKSGAKIYFKALYAGDLYVNGNDVGIGVFLGGPPRFIGGQNTGSGIIGGFVEVTPWSAWQEAYWATPFGAVSGGDNGIWHDVETSGESTTASFNGTVEPIELDNGAGVEFDQNLAEGLEKNAEASFTIINRTQIPSGLQISPASQTLTQGQGETVTVTALDTAKQPYAGKPLHFTVTGSNPQTGSVTTNAAGQAQISYIGTNAGADTIQMYLDLGGSGTQTPNDPTGTATVTWLPKPPTPNSTYTVQSVKTNSDGTITIVFVPAQGGTATLEVTVPTGTIARKEAIAARHHRAKKCRRGQVKIKGKCRPKTTVSGKVSATGVAGVPLTLTVAPSGNVRKALQKGKTVHLTATLSYKSALGGAPTVQTYHVTVRGKRKHGHRRH